MQKSCRTPYKTRKHHWDGTQLEKREQVSSFYLFLDEKKIYLLKKVGEEQSERVKSKEVSVKQESVLTEVE